MVGGVVGGMVCGKRLHSSGGMFDGSGRDKIVRGWKGWTGTGQFGCIYGGTAWNGGVYIWAYESLDSAVAAMLNCAVGGGRTGLCVSVRKEVSAADSKSTLQLCRCARSLRDDRCNRQQTLHAGRQDYWAAWAG